MKNFAEYLAEYIQHELEELMIPTSDINTEMLEEAIDSYESIEGVRIKFIQEE